MVRRPPISTCVLALSIAFAATASAQQRPADDHRVLPDFDSRTGQRAAVTPDSGVRTGLDQLRTALGPSLRARFDRSTGYVSRLTAGRRGIGAYRANAPRAVAQQFLREYGGLIGLEPADLVTLVVAREYRSFDEPVTHVQYRQLVAGVPVFGAALHLNVDADGSVIAVSSDGIVGRTTGRNRPAGGLSAEFAIQAAAANVRPEFSISPVRRTGPTGPAQTLTYAAGPFQRDIEVEQALFPVERTLRPAWVVTIEPVGFPQTYTIVVDGETGEILYRRNLQLYVDGYGLVLQSDATAAVDPRLPDRHPAGSTPSGAGDPADGCPPVANYAVRGLTGPFLDSGSVLFGNELAGNNVDVSLNVEGTRGAAGQEIDGDWVFAYPFNSSSSAETSLCFASNFAHDFFYALGFDEAAGNFQVDNFSRGGAGGDPLSVVARASGRNNATFRPAPDGSSPTMSLFLWDGQGCWAEDVDGDSTSDVDSAYDADIFLHEFHHGVSHRLNPSFTGAEADAIGEGGSDFFAYSVFGDTRLAEYAFPPSGIRQVNGKTYADWLCLFGFFCEEHLNGEIWANVLWDIRERFRSDQRQRQRGGRGQRDPSSVCRRSEALSARADDARPPRHDDPGGPDPQPVRRPGWQREPLPAVAWLCDPRDGGERARHEGHGDEHRHGGLLAARRLWWWRSGVDRDGRGERRGVRDR